VNELATASRVGRHLNEADHPDPWRASGVRAKMLGLDPLYVANEGKLIAVVPPGAARPPGRGHARPSAGKKRRDHRRGRRTTSGQGGIALGGQW